MHSVSANQVADIFTPYDKYLHHIEPGSEAAKKFDNFDVFWDTLVAS